MAKSLNDNEVMGLVGTASTNYIQKISDGTTKHVLAVENGITFFNGKADSTGVTWDGIQPLEVIIPTLSDIVSNPVVLKGVVDSAADIPSSASNGDLLYIGTTGEYWNQACEAGDMAIYYNSAWHVISGENQITINAAAATTESGNDYEFSISGTPKTILNVEGKTVTLVLDYADIRSKVAVDKEGTEGLPVTGGKVNVAAKYVGLSQVDGTTLDISKTESIDLPTALASGAVTINESVLASGDFNFTAGSFPTIAKNAEAISVTTSHNMTIAKSGADGATGDYVTDVVAIKGVAFAAATSASNDLAYVGGLSAASGKSFVSGLHAWTDADGQNTPDFTVYGAVTADSNANTFATGFGAASTSGDVVSSITVGTVSIAEGAGILTGLSGKGNTVLTSVTFGTAVSDSANAWFYNGLDVNGSDVVTAVDFGSTTLVADVQSSFASNAMVAASVSNHVLTFTSAAFMTPVSVSTSGQGTTKAGFTKSGVSLTGFDSASDTFTTGSLSQATTSISYKSLATAAVSLTQDSIKYYLDKGEGNAYDVVMSYVKFDLTDATMSKNTPVLSNTAITANIPAGQVAVDLNAGTLPSLEISAPSAGLTGSVGTSLTTTSVSWLGIDSTKAATIPGAYTLVEDSATFTGAIEVAKADQYDVNNATVAIPAGAFVTDVYVDGVAVSVNPSNQGE